jgi:hypothetical protein
MIFQPSSNKSVILSSIAFQEVLWVVLVRAMSLARAFKDATADIWLPKKIKDAEKINRAIDNAIDPMFFFMEVVRIVQGFYPTM